MATNSYWYLIEKTMLGQAIRQDNTRQRQTTSAKKRTEPDELDQQRIDDSGSRKFFKNRIAERFVTDLKIEPPGSISVIE